ncbi:MAG: hypothetical protein WAX89_07050 [Alphaproteobacteria bacterium]
MEPKPPGAWWLANLYPFLRITLALGVVAGLFVIGELLTLHITNGKFNEFSEWFFFGMLNIQHYPSLTAAKLNLIIASVIFVPGFTWFAWRYGTVGYLFREMEPGYSPIRDFQPLWLMALIICSLVVLGWDMWKQSTLFAKQPLKFEVSCKFDGSSAITPIKP